MSLQGRYRNDNNTDLLERIKSLEERLSKLERSPQAASQAVNTGGITIRGGALDVLRNAPGEDLDKGFFSIGSDVFTAGETGMAMHMARSQSVPGGNIIFGSEDEVLKGEWLAFVKTVDGSDSDPDFCFPTYEIYDKSGSPILSDSLNARRGMAHPRIPISWSGPFISTTSTVYSGDIGKAEWPMYHPHLYVNIEISNDASNSSELRIVDASNGAVVVGPLSQTAGFVGFVQLYIKRSSMTDGNGANGNFSMFFVQFRRVAGAATVRARIISMVGLDNSWFSPW